MGGFLIGLHGKAGTGKDITARLIQHELPNYRIIAFGDVIKRIAEVIYHIPVNNWEERRFKTLHRDKLEKIGRAIATLDDGNAVIDATLIGLENNAIIKDVRTRHEAEIVRGMNGIMVKIVRDVDEIDNIVEIIDESDFDYILNNNGDIENLEKNIKEMLDYFKLR